MGKTKYFGTDGIRGKVGKPPLVPDFILKLGYAAGKVLSDATKTQPTFAVGRDTRHSGQMLQNALVSGLLASGASVIDLGVIPTPGVAFLTRELNANAGVVISASHNPFSENGIKFFDFEGMKLPEEIEVLIEELLQNMELIKELQKNDFGSCIDGREMRNLYLNDLVNEHQNLNFDDLTIVLDCANGAASEYAPSVFARLGASVITINASPTGKNINYKAGSEYVRSWPHDLALLIKQYNAHFAVVFDGDADRVIFLDEKGNLIDGDHMLAVLATDLKTKHRLLGNTVVSTTMANSALKGFFSEKDINYIETPVGDKYVMKELVDLMAGNEDVDQLGLGGEQSGHIILMDNRHRTGDGIRSALYVIKAYLSSHSESLSHLAKDINKYPQLIASCFVEDKVPLQQIESYAALVNSIKEKLLGLVRFNARYSGTEPKCRLMLESDHRHNISELSSFAWELCEFIQQQTHTHRANSIEVLNVANGGLISKET
jgi:phosphoglucosamine mutase